MGRYVKETSAAKGGCYGYMRVSGHISHYIYLWVIYFFRCLMFYTEKI